MELKDYTTEELKAELKRRTEIAKAQRAEEKARAIDIVKQMIADGQVSQEVAEKYFPELKESEDERIRESLLEYLHTLPNHYSHDGVCAPEWIAWLEKQANSTVNDEPKFHEGDWVVYNHDICQIVKREEGCNKLVTVFGIEKELVNERNLSTARLWTIADAKDGDVLATSAGAFIYNGNNGGGSCPGSYCGINTLGRFQTGVKTHWTGKKVYPATKEQRDLLFQKMHEAGYRFDFEKKELKKLKFRVGDEVKTENEESLTITKIDERGYWSNDLFICDFDNECVWDLVEQKPAWSEEDERNMQNIDSVLFYDKTLPEDTCVKLRNFLKTLKQRIGG